MYYQAIEKTFQDPSIFEPVSQDPESIVTSLVELLHRQHGKSYPWAVGHGRQLPAGYILAKRKKDFRSGRPIISFVDSPFRPMLNILARMIFQLIPVACPNHFASGDVYTRSYPSSNLHPSMQISFWSIRTSLASSPASIKIGSSVPGTCS